MDDVQVTKMAQLQTCRLLKMTIVLHYIDIIKIVKIRKADIGYIRTHRIM